MKHVGDILNFYLPLKAKMLDSNQANFDVKIHFEFSIKKCVPNENKKCAKNIDSASEFDIQLKHEIQNF